MRKNERRLSTNLMAGRASWGVFEKWFLGRRGDPPVPSGDSPDGTGATVRANGHGPFATLLAGVPVGGSPAGAGESPAPPIFITGSSRFDGTFRDWEIPTDF